MASATLRSIGRIGIALAVIALAWLGTSRGSVTDTEKITRLVERIDRYHNLFQERNYSDSYDMLAAAEREGGEDKKEWIRAGRKMDNGIKILGWEVRRIWIAGDRAKVRMAIRGKTRETFFRWEEGVDEEDDFWVFEDNDWYYIPLNIRDWDDTQGVEVPVPKQPMKVDIKEKD